MPTPAVEHATDPATSNAKGHDVSEAVYWEKYYGLSDVHYEWNDGRLEEKPVSDHLTYRIYAWFLELLTRYLKAHPIAETVGLEMGFRLALPDKVVIRKPDLGVVRHDNPVKLEPLDRSYHGVFDLCVEALSDGSAEDKRRDQVLKRQEYARGGVAEYYILHHKSEHLAFYALTRQDVYHPLAEREGIVQSRVLPGFRFRKHDLLHRLSIDDLRWDPLYRDFLFPEWWQAEQNRKQAEQDRKQAEQDRKQAEQNRKQAEQERNRAEQERDALLQARRETISSLDAMGLDSNQIAQALAIDPSLVTEVLRSR